MVTERRVPSPERVALLHWTACIGAVTAEALAERRGTTVSSARAQLLAAVRAEQLSRHRPLAGQASLFTVTRAGLQACGLRGVDPCRVSASNASHLITCAWVAVRLERAYPDHRLAGERELRREERDCAMPLASACVGVGPDGGPLLHRPDLVLWPAHAVASGAAPPLPSFIGGDERPASAAPASVPSVGLAVAVEVELTVKAPRRLLEIVRAWGRCRCVAGVVYLAPPDVERALVRAIHRADVEERIVVLPLTVL
jgi:hypothetical protein